MAIDRKPLLEEMTRLAANKIACGHCVGECCTSKSNSMQITQGEAEDILRDLSARELLSNELIQKLRQNVKEFRLDVDIPSHGGRPNLRRTYTCPFYSPGPAGCLLSADKKPLGCLAFNPIKEAATGLSSGCRSDQTALEKITPRGDKWPIPVAVLRLL